MMKNFLSHCIAVLLFLALGEAWNLNHDERDFFTVTTPGLELLPRSLNNTRLGELPGCAGTCFTEVLPRYGCQINDNCFCNDGNVTVSLTACVKANCTLPGSLAAQKFYAETCDKPVRDRRALSRGVCWALFSVASLFVFGRFISRMPSLGGSGYSWDDWTVVVCYVLLIPTDVSAEVEVRHGLGMDMYLLTIDDIVMILEMFYLGEILYNIIVMLTKVSLVFLYLRIWSVDSVTKAFRVACWVIIGFLIAIWIIGALVMIFQCTPINYTWLKVTGSATGRCIQVEPFTYTYGALNIATDVIVFFLPIHGLLKLKISWKQKVGLCSVFLVGFLVTICSIVRLQYLVRLGDTTNISWDFQFIGMWSLVEVNASLICCCMPAIWGLLHRIFSRSGIITPAPSETTDSEKASPEESSDNASSMQLASRNEKWAAQAGEHITSASTTSIEAQNVRTMLWRQVRRGDQQTAVLYHAQTPHRPHFVEIAHVPRTEISTAQLIYRDQNGVVHEVSIVDRPQNSDTGSRLDKAQAASRSPHTLLPMRPSAKRHRSDTS